MTPCHYEINIALDGIHYAKVELPAHILEDRAKGMAHMFRLKFHEHEGFKVTLSYIECYGKGVNF